MTFLLVFLHQDFSQNETGSHSPPLSRVRDLPWGGCCKARRRFRIQKKVSIQMCVFAQAEKWLIVRPRSEDVNSSGNSTVPKPYTIALGNLRWQNL